MILQIQKNANVAMLYEINVFYEYQFYSEGWLDMIANHMFQNQ
jgi:hypothetical protein